MIRQPGYERLIAATLATSLHVAVGCFLLLAARAGVMPPAGAGGGAGKAILVSLIPLASPGSSAAAGNPRQAHSRFDHSREDEKAVDPFDRPSTQPEAARQSIADQASGAANPEDALANARTVAGLPSAEMLAWRAKLQAHLARYRLYPADARDGGGQGVVFVHFVMDRDGHVRDVWIEASSGVASIDREALAAVRRAEPLPQLPGDFPDQLDIRLPVSFRLS